MSDEALVQKKSEREQDFTAAGHDSIKIVEDVRNEANNSQFCGAPADSMASDKVHSLVHIFLGWASDC